MEAMESYAQVESLQQTIYQGEGNTILLIDKLEEKVNQSEQVLNRLFLEEILGKLEGEERELIYQRYFQEKTQSVIAKEMGISQVQVSRMEKRILRKIQEEVLTHTTYKRKEVVGWQEKNGGSGCLRFSQQPEYWWCF